MLRHWKRYELLPIAVVLLVQVACSKAKPTVDDARRAFLSGCARCEEFVTLTDFKKVNGRDEIHGGTPAYRLDFEATFTTKKSVVYEGGLSFSEVGDRVALVEVLDGSVSWWPPSESWQSRALPVRSNAPSARSPAEAPPRTPAEDFPRSFITVDGGQLDSETNLMWADHDNGAEIDWHGARRYVESYSAGGYKDWRLPTIAELKGLVNTGPRRVMRDCGGLSVVQSIRLTCIRMWAADDSPTTRRVNPNTSIPFQGYILFESTERGWVPVKG